MSLRNVCDGLEREGIDRTASRRHTWQWEGNGPDISPSDLLEGPLLWSGMVVIEIKELLIDIRIAEESYGGL